MAWFTTRKTIASDTKTQPPTSNWLLWEELDQIQGNHDENKSAKKKSKSFWTVEEAPKKKKNTSWF